MLRSVRKLRVHGPDKALVNAQRSLSSSALQTQQHPAHVNDDKHLREVVRYAICIFNLVAELLVSWDYEADCAADTRFIFFRKLDYDNYVCGLLLPQEVRAAYFAIRAVNSEIATIKDTIRSNQATGKIRMQWWREKIYDLYVPPSSARAPQETFLLRGLEKAIHDHDLTRRWFERLLDARDQDLDTDQPQELADLEVYAEKTAASLLYLTLECLGIRDNTADRVASHAGVAIGLTTLLRGTPYHSTVQQIYLPEELMLKHNLTIDDHFEAAQDPAKGAKLAPVVFDVACQAVEHLREARALQSELPKGSRAAFLPAVATSLYLEKLEKVNFNAYDPMLFQRSAVNFHYEILKSYFLRKY